MAWMLILLAIAFAGLAYVKLKKGAAVAPAQPSPADAHKLHWLLAQSGPNEGKSYHVGNRRVTIGRGPSNYIQVNDPNVSRTQCQLFVEDDDLVVVDMTSSNGTFIAGQPVKRHALKQGDRLGVGNAEFEYHRTGEFNFNAAWEPKDADASARSATTALTSGEVQDMLDARKSLIDAGGDVDKAAAAMGKSVKDFTRLLG